MQGMDKRGVCPACLFGIGFLRFILRRRNQQTLRSLPDGSTPRLALQFGMKPSVAIQVDRGQVEDVEIARYPGGFTDVDVIKHLGKAG